MNAIRRGLVLLGLTVAVIIGASVPAFASFSEAIVVKTTIATTTVAAPTSIVGKITCGHPTATMGATWALSPTRGVSGYVVTVYFSDGVTQAVPLGPAATSWSASITDYYVTAYSIQYTVTTQTTYGWSKESPRTAAFQC